MKKLILIAILSLSLNCFGDSEKNMTSDNIRLFENMDVWPVARSVESEDTVQIYSFFQARKDLINGQEPKFGMTLLYWATLNGKALACKALIKAGANPNIKSKRDITVVMLAADDETSDLLKLFIANGGDVNAVTKKSSFTTPLITASETSLENTKLLIEVGANVNYYDTQFCQSALIASIRSAKIDIVKYLIMEKGADFTKRAGVRVDSKGNPKAGEVFYTIDLFRKLLFPLDSKEYKTKMEVVAYMKERGVNYWETKIPSYYYKSFDKEYLSKF